MEIKRVDALTWYLSINNYISLCCHHCTELCNNLYWTDYNWGVEGGQNGKGIHGLTMYVHI